ncbi:hypothetical protein HaLaN_16175 [Haematococcus lacustris]|uniref:Uncharacterized protein n=1 Tax=Haematococcus lacustris TaxID=44745 RepID=A0A699ZJV2_HAELA|nr:hypothetical protein HaLaN_16175 [Haematococcus lacustris]
MSAGVRSLLLLSEGSAAGLLPLPGGPEGHAAAGLLLFEITMKVKKRCCRGCMVACQLRLPKEVLDPEALLTGRWVMALKVALAVCCLAAVGSAVYVMVTFSLDVWSASSAVESQAAAVAEGARLLLGSVGNATLLVRRLDNLTYNTIRAPALLSSLQSLATYLDDPTTDPPALTQALTSAASLPASLPPPLAAWSISLAALRDPAPAATASSLPGLLQAALAPVAAANPRAMASNISALAAQLALPPDTLTLQSELTAVQALLATAPSLPPIRTALANIRQVKGWSSWV